MVYIVIFEENSSDAISFDRDSMLERVGKYLKVTANSYMLVTDKPPVEIREELKKEDENVSIFISQISAPAAWKNLDVDNESIKMMFRS